VIDEITAAMAQLSMQGSSNELAKTRWSVHSREWEPVYAFTELGHALSAAWISLDDYQDGAS
jgi:hypothetical protein